MELPEAQKEFVDILNRVKDPATLNGFLSWVKENWYSGSNAVVAETDAAVIVNGVEAEEFLETIAADLRAVLPIEAQMPSETIVFSQVGPNSDCNPATTINVDGFLYDDKLVDKLSDEGKLPRNYCLRCGSRDTKPLTFISHSASKENLEHIFRTLMPELTGKHILDIGSRFGAVLFGAFAYSQATRITGVEINPDMAALSQTMVNKYNMQSRVEVLTGDVRMFPQIVATADVIVMHNVFEFFAPVDVQRDLWIWLRQSIKRGAILLTSPRLDESIGHLNTGIVLDQWVVPVATPSDAMDETDSDASAGADMDLVHLYRVI